MATGLVFGVIALLVAVGIVADMGSNDPWDPRLEPYVAFVESTRGLEFARPVAVRQTDVGEALRASDEEASAFDDEVDRAGADGDGDGGSRFAATDAESLAFSLLGFYGSGAADSKSSSSNGEAAEIAGDLEDASAETRATSAAAFYDTSTDEIIIPPGEIDSWLASVIVHELTHALQAQNGLFDYIPQNDDESAMQLALIEGDADRIEASWIAAQDTATQQAVYDVYISNSGSYGPSGFLDVLFATPYVLGDPAVEHIIASEGQAELDHLMREGAGSSERLIDPFSPTPAPASAKKRLAADPDGAEIIGGGTLGPVLLYQMLAPQIGVEDALAAVTGYDIDDFVVYEQQGTMCVDVVVWTDSSDDSQELARALRELGRSPSIGDRGAPTAESVLFSVCEGETVTSPELQTIEVLSPLIDGSWIALEFAAEGDAVARCLGFAAAVHSSTLGEDAEWADHQMLAEAARPACSD